MKILYEEMRPEEFLESLNKFPVAYLPLGTLEWHGLHMPLGADGLQAKGIMEKIAAKIGGTGASEERGKMFIEKNVELASKNLQEIVKGISFESRSMNYHDVKSLLKE